MQAKEIIFTHYLTVSVKCDTITMSKDNNKSEVGKMAKVLKALRNWFDEAFDSETYYDFNGEVA